MHLGNAPIIALEKREKILRQIVFIDFGKRAHDAEVERDIVPAGRDENIARVHVGVKKTVAEYLSKKNLDTGAR